MKRVFFAAVFCVALAAGGSLANPEFRLSYPNGIPRVEIAGNWSLSHYTVSRATTAQGPFTQITDSDVLCIGSCFADDYEAVPGRTYFYRFDVNPPAGSPTSFGPYSATISTRLARSLAATVSPNPGWGPSRVTLFAAGAPGATIGVDATLLDLQGRRVSRLYQGTLPVGTTQVSWTGRRDDGREVPTGVYLLRFRASDGRQSVTRVMRVK